MSKKLAIFDFPQNTQLRVHQIWMPNPKTLTFPLSKTAIIFLGHSNGKMLHDLHFSYQSILCTARHDQSKVQFKPCTPEFRIGFVRRQIYTVDEISSTKNSNPFSCEFNGKKIKKSRKYKTRRRHVKFTDSG